ncbi:DUF2568 domain-containing protein [Oceanobacillus profundus]|uniref:DUF2568 domain-containing protein n=1 Tax=Oceanobacillus profundus TaxID=372463 RepID=UPI0037099D62
MGIPSFIATFWGLNLSPKAAIKLPFSIKLILQFTIFVLAALSLHTIGKSGIGIVFFLTIVINKMLLFLLSD